MLSAQTQKSRIERGKLVALREFSDTKPRVATQGHFCLENVYGLLLNLHLELNCFATLAM